MSNDIKLGQYPSRVFERDAVHVAIAALIAAEDLVPAQRVALRGAGKVVAAKPDDVAVGIVDPFLPYNVVPGDTVWVCLFPNSVTGMRHHWEHPQFVDDSDKARVDKLGEDATAAMFIENVATKCGVTSQKLLRDADYYISNDEDEYVMDNTEAYKHVTNSEWARFWGYYEKLTGKKCKNKYAPYTCSC